MLLDHLQRQDVQVGIFGRERVGLAHAPDPASRDCTEAFTGHTRRPRTMSTGEVGAEDEDFAVQGEGAVLVRGAGVQGAQSALGFDVFQDIANTFGMAAGRRTGTHQRLGRPQAAQCSQDDGILCGDPFVQPCLVEGDDGVAISVLAKDERISQGCAAPDIDGRCGKGATLKVVAV